MRVVQLAEGRNHLRCLTEAHLVGQHHVAPRPPRVEHPVDALELVWPQQPAILERGRRLKPLHALRTPRRAPRRRRDARRAARLLKGSECLGVGRQTRRVLPAALRDGQPRPFDEEFAVALREHLLHPQQRRIEEGGRACHRQPLGVGVRGGAVRRARRALAIGARSAFGCGGLAAGGALRRRSERRRLAHVRLDAHTHLRVRAEQRPLRLPANVQVGGAAPLDEQLRLRLATRLRIPAAADKGLDGAASGGVGEAVALALTLFTQQLAVFRLLGRLRRVELQPEGAQRLAHLALFEVLLVPVVVLHVPQRRLALLGRRRHPLADDSVARAALEEAASALADPLVSGEPPLLARVRVRLGTAADRSH
mmetsp:Transcript_24562/g.80078  ORF Transcript_24562/g.80078 Transcript_24562/m.80078 type:complete len:367 (-) Transcript_24562:1100-2200(-)